MKNQTHRPLRPSRPTPPRPAPTRRLDPLARAARHRRLYTDFLALAFYPGMRNEPAVPPQALPHN